MEIGIFWVYRYIFERQSNLCTHGASKIIAYTLEKHSRILVAREYTQPCQFLRSHFECTCVLWVPLVIRQIRTPTAIAPGMVQMYCNWFCLPNSPIRIRTSPNAYLPLVYGMSVGGNQAEVGVGCTLTSKQLKLKDAES